jgi:hypothetical protein
MSQSSVLPFVLQSPTPQQQTVQNPTQAFPLGVSDGSLLVFVLAWANTSGSAQIPTDTNGNQWSLIDSQQTPGTLRTIYVFAAQNAGDGSCTVTVPTDASRTYSWAMFEVVGSFIGLDGSPIDLSSPTPATVINTGVLTTTLPGSIIFAITKCGSIATNPPLPWQSNGTNNFSVAFQVAANPGSYSASWTATSSTWATTILAFQPSAAGPQVPIGPLPLISDLPLSTNLLASPDVLRNPIVGMVSYRSTWSKIQAHQPAAITNDPNDPSYTWTFLDQAFAQAQQYGKLVSFHLAVQGFGTPGWVKSNAAQFIDIAGDSVSVYWDSYYQSALIALIQAMGKRYGSRPGLFKTVWTICSIGGSWVMPHNQNANWQNSAAFTCPAFGATVTVPTTVNSGMNINQYCQIPGFGFFKCVNAPPGPGTAQTKLLNPGFAGNANSGTIAAGTTILVSDIGNLEGPAYNYTTAQLVSAQNAILQAAAAAFPNSYIQLQVGTSGSLDLSPGPTYRYNAATQIAQFAYANLPKFAMDRDGFDPYTPAPPLALAAGDKSGWYLLAQPTTGSANTSGTTGVIPKGGAVFGQQNWPAFDPSGQYTPASTNNYKANHGVPYTDPIPVIAGAILTSRYYFLGLIEMYEQDLRVFYPQVPVVSVPWEDGPLLAAPYCGQNQAQQIQVPASIAYKSLDREEGPWAMMPYASLYPPPTQGPDEAWVPPPVKQTDIFTAQQTWPL